MRVTSNRDELTALYVAAPGKLGFHATSSRAASAIERRGFLPDKIFDEQSHDRLKLLAKTNQLDTTSYEQWLWLRSVTFSREPRIAFAHVENGNSGGQGLRHMEEMLAALFTKLSGEDAEFADGLDKEIQGIRAAAPVIYAVDLKGLAPRLQLDKAGVLYHYRWHPDAPMPAISAIAPARIILRLDIR